MSGRDVCRELHSGLRDRKWAGRHEELLICLDGLTGVQQCIRNGLQQSFDAEDWGMFERYVLAAYRKPSQSYTATLCAALRRRVKNLNNEDVAEALGAIADPAAVGCLEEALDWAPPWDEFRQLGVKCIWALSSINNKEARDALGRAVKSNESPVIREAAAKELELLRAGLG